MVGFALAVTLLSSATQVPATELPSVEISKDNTGFKGFATGKPVVVEETFPLKCSPQDLDKFIGTSKPACRRLDRLLLGYDTGRVAASRREPKPSRCDGWRSFSNGQVR